MFFRIVRKIRCETLTITVTFEQSEGRPCQGMLDHADDVETTILSEYEYTEQNAESVAFEIVNKFRRVASVEVEDENGDAIFCSFRES